MADAKSTKRKSQTSKRATTKRRPIKKGPIKAGAVKESAVKKSAAKKSAVTKSAAKKRATKKPGAGAKRAVAVNALPRLELPVEEHTLRCGATLLVSPRPGAPTTSVQLNIRGGHSLDPQGKEGLSSLTGALVTEGTAQRDESAIAELLEPVGGSISGGSSGVSGSVVASEWKLLLDLIAEVTTEPTYPKERVERQRARVLQRLTIDEDDPRVQAAQVFRELVYGEHWLGRSPRGSVASVGKIRRADLARHHAKNWVASRAVIAVCGDLDGAQVKRFLDRRLADWTSGSDLPRPNEEFEFTRSKARAFKAKRQQVHVYLGHLGVRRKHPDYEALVVMDHILGTGPGFTDRISRRLRDEQGLAYTVQANIHSSAGVHPGTFLAYIGTSPDKVELAVRGFVEEIQRIRDEPVGEDELQLVQSYLTGSTLLGYERAARRAQTMVYAHRIGLPFDYIADLPQRFMSIGIDDIQRVAREHLHPESLCLAAGGPVASAELTRILKAAQGR